MLKQWNVLMLFGLVALVGAFGCAKEEAGADTDTGEATDQVQTEGGGSEDASVDKLMGAGDGRD